MMSAQVHVEPADYDRHSRVGAHGYEEQAGVFHVDVVVHGDQDAEACNGDGDGDERECEAVAGEIRAEGYDHGESECTCPGRNTMQLCLNGRVPVCGNDAWCEEGVAVGGNDHAEVHEAAEDNFEVLEDTADVPNGDFALCCRAALVRLKAGFDVGPF